MPSPKAFPKVTLPSANPDRTETGVSNATRCPFSGHQNQSGCQLSHGSQQVLPLIFCSGTDLVPALGTSHISFTQTAWMLLIQHQHSPCQLWEHLSSHPGDFPCSFCRESKHPSFKMGFADWWGKVMNPLCHTDASDTPRTDSHTETLQIPNPFRICCATADQRLNNRSPGAQGALELGFLRIFLLMGSFQCAFSVPERNQR